MIKLITIENFRSIESLTIDIRPISNKTCNIYLGKNETGKSSILRAISLISPDVDCDYDENCNKKGKKLGQAILIEYDLDFGQIKGLSEEIKRLKIPKELLIETLIEKITKRVEISSKRRQDKIWIYTEYNPSKIEYVIKNNVEIVSIDSLYSGDENINKENIGILIGPQYVLLDHGNLETYLEKNLIEYITDQLPSCIYWEPSKEYLINEPIDLTQFAKNPNLSIPLRNIFHVADIYKIDERIELIKNDFEEKAQLKEELSNQITHYINKVWPEHLINIRIEIENMDCIVMVEDKDNSLPKYKMQQRSDGFKQFISILLNLSIENKSSKKNNIILMDEPEVHLHPSGIKYMRDELLKISERNMVFISTHSPYLVDKLNLERHYKVTKEKSETTVKQIDPSNPYEEEVIYEALGTSVYEFISPNMVIFEGTIDKDLFDVFNKKFKSEYNPVNVGSISADGADKIPQYTKFLNGAFVKGFVVVDSDAGGIKIKKQLIKESNAFNQNNTFEINDIYQTNITATIEDLYPKDTIVSTVLKFFKVELSFDNTPILKQIEMKNKVNDSKIDLKNLKSTLAQEIIKDVSSLTKDAAKEKFTLLYEFFANLNEKLKSA